MVFVVWYEAKKSICGSIGLIAFLVSALMTVNVFASGSAAVVGSFQHRGNAEKAQRQISAQMSLDADIVETEINARKWFRVIIPDSSPRILVASLHRRGFKDAWPLIDSGAPKLQASTASISSAVPIRRSNASDSQLFHDVGPGVSATPDTNAPTQLASIQRGAAMVPVKTKMGRTSGHEKLVETIEGIPIHQIMVSNFDHADIDIKLDGHVDETIWQQAPLFDNMIVSVPGTGEPGHYPTETRMIASEKGLYVSAVMHQPPETLVSRMSTRDDFIDRDTFGITIDATGEGLIAYWFIIALGDSVMDGKVLPERNYQRDWDGPWRGKTARLDDGWSTEIFLPWSMMSMQEVAGPRNIGFAVSRQVSHANERYQWPGHPYASSRFVSALNTFNVEGVQPVRQFSIIPFASSTTDEARDDDEARAGFDMSWKPSPMLELSMSALPDFGAVEADNVVLNLTAFETYFPEKRLFFLEGNEIFNNIPRSNPGTIMRIQTNDNFATTSRKVFTSTFMPTPISMMNTRRIGGTANQVTVPDGITANRGEKDLPTDLLGAAKLTGSFGDMRYGVLAAMEDDVEWMGTTDDLGQRVDIEDDGREFAVARFAYESIGASRRSVGYMGTYVSGPLYDAIVHGVDGHYTDSSGRLIVDTQLIASDVADVTGEGMMFDLKYSPGPRIQHKVEFEYFDEDVQINDLGFLRRNDYNTLQYALLYNRTKGIGSIKDIRGTVVVRQGYNISENQVVESGIYWRNSMVFPGRNTLKTSLGYLPSRYEDIDSRGNGAYKTDDRIWVDAHLATDAGKMLSYSVSLGGLQENLGDWTYNATAGLTFRPNDLVSADLDIRYKRRKGWLVYQGDRNFGAYDAIDWQPSLKLNWFMAPGHQLLFTLQWAGVKAREEGFYAIPVGDGELVPTERTRADHDFTVSIVTAQLRYRWEIAPLTDLYLVYNRGNTLPSQLDTDFSGLFEDALSDPIVNSFVAKLRYRFGN